ncbi:hypothetical protein Tco_1003593 [Tanacetum coccineum]|uniref:Uncharacterized protein n=1 Tax=Tanacetum coccineum TaxID=301880 RepID=A0ABQ5FAZ3_9ASTR
MIFRWTIPRAHRTPTFTASPQRKKRKQSAGETSSPQKSLKVTIKQKQVVEGERDEESYADKFAASMLHYDFDDPGDRIELGSHKEHPEVIDDDDENKSPRINLSSDKNIAQELTDTVSLSTATASKYPHKKRRISSKYSHLPGALRRMCRRQRYMIRDMEHQDNDPAYWGTEVKCSSFNRSPKIPHKTAIDEDEVIPKDETPELIIEFQNVDKHVPTIFDRARMEATLNDILNNQFQNAEEYAYHLEQATNFMDN